MNNVLQFQSARLQLHLAMLRYVGVPDALTWRVLGWPRDRYWDGDLYAAPMLVALRGEERVCGVELARGRTPETLDESRKLMAALNAVVLHQHFERRGRACVTTSSIVFEDRGSFEVEVPDSTRNYLRQRAQRAMRDYRFSKASTRELARLLQADGVVLDARPYNRTDLPNKPRTS
jgi:hypothetical protein